jgi:hypothetical protein
MDSQDKIDQLDMMQGKLFEAELNERAALLETKRVQFQAWVDSLWTKYGKTKGEDRLLPDGTWAKVEQK